MQSSSHKINDIKSQSEGLFLSFILPVISQKYPRKQYRQILKVPYGVLVEQNEFDGFSWKQLPPKIERPFNSD